MLFQLLQIELLSQCLARPQAFHDFFGSLACFAIGTCLPDMSVKGSRYVGMTCMITDAVMTSVHRCIDRYLTRCAII